jgi:FixJ family two-component response regulator
MTGLQLADELKNIKPTVPVVLITGFSEAVTPDRVKQHRVSDVIRKPFTSTALAAAVRAAIDKGRVRSTRP